MADDPNKISQADLDAVSDFARRIEDARSEVGEVYDKTKEIAASFKNSNDQTKETFSLFTSVKNQLIDVIELNNRLGTSYIRQDQITKKINAAVSDRSRIEALIIKAQDEGTPDADIRLELLNKELETVDKTQAFIKEIEGRLEKSNDEYTKMYFKASAVKKVISSIAAIPILGPLLQFEAIGEKFQKSIGAGIKEVVSQLGSLIKLPFVQMLIVGAGIKSMISAVLEMDKSVTSLSNNLGLSEKSSRSIFYTFGRTSIEGNKLVEALDKGFLSVRNLANGTLELQNSLETNALFTDRMVQSQVLMTKQMGLSAEEAAGVQKFSLLTGKSADSILQTAIKQNTAAISYRKIIKEVSTISAELSMRFGNDPEKIAKAVVQANKLGMSLEETRKISSSLLNFEQSIEGELESELLLGRQFNFEKARELALMGKSSEAAGELLGQIGGITELEKMNVIQRERIASAIGLSSDELSKAAKEQAVLNALGDQNKDALAERYELLRKNNDQAGIAKLQEDARKIQGGDILLQDIARANLNQRFEESVNRIKDVFTTMALPLSIILDKIAKLLQYTFVLKSLLVLAAAAMTAIAISATIASFGAAAAAAAPWIAGIGAIGMGLGTAIAVNDFQEKPDGTVIMSPAGTFKPNKKDYITASTNPPFQGGGGGDDSAMMSKMDQLIYHVAAGKMIKYDTITAGTAHGMSYNSYA
jgi:hypothetical protein